MNLVDFWHNVKRGSPDECWIWQGNGKEIVDMLEKNGLIINWDGSENTRIRVTSN